MDEGARPAATARITAALAVGGVVGIAYAVAQRVGAAGPLVAAALAAPAIAVAELWAGRGDGRARRTSPPSAETVAARRAVDELADACMDLRSEGELAAALDVLFTEHLGLRDAALWLLGGDGASWRRTGDGEAPLIDADAAVVELLEAHRAPITAAEIPAVEDDARRPLRDLFEALEAEVLIPLVDRESVLGVIAAAGAASGATARDLLDPIQQAASRTLTYLELLRAAEMRVGSAREGEIAAAVQHASAPGLREHLGERLSITSYYQPAEAFGGDFFSAAELADGRTFVAIGDVAGRGMPAALISAAVAGACEAAERLLSPGAPIVEIVDHVNRLVHEVGRDRYAMSCFFALIDPDARSMTFADAGHPFPYVCRKRIDGGTDLRALVARGVPLGLEAEPRVEVVTTELEEGDAIVMFTDAVVEALAPGDDTPYGDRRLRRFLRRRADSARLCRAIVDDVLEYCGARPMHDDMTVAVVRIGAPPGRPSRISRP